MDKLKCWVENVI